MKTSWQHAVILTPQQNISWDGMTVCNTIITSRTRHQEKEPTILEEDNYSLSALKISSKEDTNQHHHSKFHQGTMIYTAVEALRHTHQPQSPWTSLSKKRKTRIQDSQWPNFSLSFHSASILLCLTEGELLLHQLQPTSPCCDHSFNNNSKPLWLTACQAPQGMSFARPLSTNNPAARGTYMLLSPSALLHITCFSSLHACLVSFF